MAEFPALPLWTDAYLGDTTHLSTTEHGAYCLLLMTSWRAKGCCLPDDDALLARYTKMTLDKWRKVRPILAPFFTIADGIWAQPRLQDEMQLLQSRRNQQSEAGKASARAKSQKRNNRGSTPVKRPLQRNANEKATTTPTLPIPDGIGRAAPPIDPGKALFDAGVALLKDAGITERHARALIAKWRNQHGNEAAMAAIVSAEGKSEPVSWIEGRLKSVVSANEEYLANAHATAERYRRMGLAEPPRKGGSF